MEIDYSKDENRAYYAFTCIDSEFFVRTGDEVFYTIIHEDICYPYPFINIIHTEDQKHVIDTLISITKEASKTDIARIKLKDGQYHWMLLDIMGLKQTYNGKMTYRIELFHVDMLKKATREQTKLVLNYRTILGLMKYLYLDYDTVSTKICIYWYNGEKKMVLQQDILEHWIAQVMQKSLIQDSEHNVFHSFCEDLKQGKANFFYHFENSLLTQGKNCLKWTIQGGAVYDQNVLTNIAGVIHVVAKEGQETGLLTERTNRDALTGLLNKRAIAQYAEERLNYAGDNKIRFVIMDIDNFKNVNDVYGHMFGDEVILTVANIFNRIIGNHGVVGRIGGDEFFAVLEGVENETDLRNILKAIRVNIAWAYVDMIRNLNVSCSMGTVEYPTDGKTYSELFMKADYSLYLAKEKGKNRYIIYNKEKHGDVIKDELTQTVIGLEGQVMESDKMIIYGHLIDQLFIKKKDAIMDTFSTIGDLNGFEKINVFYGENLKCIYHWGKRYESDNNGLYIKNPAYLKRFNERGVCILDKIFIPQIESVYQHLREQEITSIVQVIIGTKDNIQGFISFDRTITRAKLSVMDAYNLEVISHLIGNILKETT